MTEALISYIALIVIVSCRAMWSNRDENSGAHHRQPTMFGAEVVR